MSDSALRLRNRGAYTSPFSGVGVEFFPLGVLPDHSGLVLHEAGYLPRNDWWNFPNVLSPFWRLYYNFRPGHKVVFPDGELALTPDRIVIIPDHQLFHCRGETPVPNLWLAFSLARRLAPDQAIPIVLAPTRTELGLLRDFARLFSGDREKGTGTFCAKHRAPTGGWSGRSGKRCLSPFPVSGGAEEPNHDRVFHAGMALLHAAIGRPEIRWRRSTPAAVTQTIHYIEAHYATPLLVPRLAHMAGICTEALARSFKKYQGETVGRFIVKVRVREAAHLLTNSDLSIDHISQKTGFPNRAYLSRVFKKITGESPAEFRRRHGVASSREDRR